MRCGSVIWPSPTSRMLLGCISWIPYSIWNPRMVLIMVSESRHCLFLSWLNAIIRRFREVGHSLSRKRWKISIADAIREGFEKIICHKILMKNLSIEYYTQKPCLDSWLQLAMGRGIEVEKSDGSLLLEHYPWEPRFYGHTLKDRGVAERIMATTASTLARPQTDETVCEDGADELRKVL